jgi:Domain of unknown function (DUF6456)
MAIEILVIRLLRRVKMQQVLVEQGLARDGRAAAARKIRSVMVNIAESPLSWLRARMRISQRQYDAGELLRKDYERALLPQRTTVNWAGPPQAKGARGAFEPGLATNESLDAKRRFHAAVEAAGPGLSDILWRVVCAGESLPDAEQALDWPRRAGRLVLSLALDRVADYYRVA